MLNSRNILSSENVLRYCGTYAYFLGKASVLAGHIEVTGFFGFSLSIGIEDSGSIIRQE